MKKIIIQISISIILLIKVDAQTTELSGVTFGFGLGYDHIEKDIFDYTLTPDTMHSLQQQILPKNRFVISSVISIKLGKLKYDQTSKKIINAKITPTCLEKLASRVSVNAAFDLINFKSDGVSFNKSIDGGVGLGFILAENLQFAAFYDFQTFRQLRDYISNNYLGKRIPNGNTYYNALDQNDNFLFYNKTVTGFSLKLVFTIGNKKTATASSTTIIETNADGSKKSTTTKEQVN